MLLSPCINVFSVLDYIQQQKRNFVKIKNPMFFEQPDRLRVSKRLKMAGKDWIRDTQYEVTSVCSGQWSYIIMNICKVMTFVMMMMMKYFIMTL